MNRVVQYATEHGTGPDDGALRQFRSTLLMSSLRLSGKLLGLVKVLVIASVFGASGALDAFWIAYTIPAMLPGVILGVVATAFIPRFMTSSEAGGQQMDWRGLNTLLTLVGIFVAALAILVASASSGIVSFMAPGLPSDVHDTAERLTAWMAIAVLFLGANAMLSTVLQAVERFALLSLESLVSNLFIIAACIFLVPLYGIDALTMGVIAGFAMHFALLVWGNRRVLWHNLRPAFHFEHADFRGASRHMTPLLIGYLGAAGMAIVDRAFLSTLDSGAISVLSYAVMLAALPMEVFGQAVMTVFYPALSRKYAGGSKKELMDVHVRGLRLLLFALIPVTLVLIASADSLVGLLLERGRFGATEADMTAAALIALALGIPATGIKYLNFRLLHARQEPWSAVFIGLFGVGLNAMLDYLLIGPYGVTGVAFATSAALVMTAVLSSLLLRRRLGQSIASLLAAPLAKIGLMSAVMLAVAKLLGMLDSLFIGDMPTWGGALWEISAYFPGLLAFILLGHYLKLPEIRILLDTMGLGSFARRRGRSP